MERISICDKKQCTGCCACVNVCRQACISMSEAEDGFFYPIIDEEKCIGCGACEKICPNNKMFDRSESAFYMAIHKDKEVLRKSSSGGAFTALANLVLREKGVVIGAYLDESDSVVRHIAITAPEELDKLRLSKYYQSNPGEIYRKTLELLVLF